MNQPWDVNLMSHEDFVLFPVCLIFHEFANFFEAFEVTTPQTVYREVQHLCFGEFHDIAWHCCHRFDGHQLHMLPGNLRVKRLQPHIEATVMWHGLASKMASPVVQHRVVRSAILRWKVTAVAAVSAVSCVPWRGPVAIPPIRPIPQTTQVWQFRKNLSWYLQMSKLLERLSRCWCSRCSRCSSTCLQWGMDLSDV